MSDVCLWNPDFIQRQLTRCCQCDIRTRRLMRSLKWDLFLAQRLRSLPGCNDSERAD